jgi:hypothetical protein
VADSTGAESVSGDPRHLDVDRPPQLHRPAQGGTSLRLDSNDTSTAEGGRGHAGVEATAADGNDDRVNCWLILQDLLPERARAGRDLDVVVGVGEGAAVVRAEGERCLVRIGVLSGTKTVAVTPSFFAT